MGDTRAVLRAFVTRAQDKYGKLAAGRADVVAVPRRKVSIGPLRLDHALGGGLDMGGFHSFYGEKSGGKTTTALRAVAACQRVCRNCFRPATDVEAVPPPAEILAEDPFARWSAIGKCTCFAEGLYTPDPPPFTDDNGKKIAANSSKYTAAFEAWKTSLEANSYEEFVCAWADLELSFDAKYAVFCGADPRRIQLFRCETAEMAIDVLHALSRTIEVDLLVLDSIAQMAPNKEIESSAEDWQQGLQARLVNKMARMLVGDGSMVTNNGRNVTSIWINQTRQKIGVMFGDPTVKPGGQGQEFAVHVELKFGRSKREMDKSVFGNKDEFIDIPISETYSFKSTKSKAGKNKEVTGTYTVRLYTTDGGKAGDLIEVDEIGKMAMHYLVTQEKKGSKGYVLGDQTFSTQKELMEKLRNDPEYLAAVKTVLLEKFMAEDQR